MIAKIASHTRAIGNFDKGCEVNAVIDDQGGKTAGSPIFRGATWPESVSLFNLLTKFLLLICCRCSKPIILDVTKRCSARRKVRTVLCSHALPRGTSPRPPRAGRGPRSGGAPQMCRPRRSLLV